MRGRTRRASRLTVDCVLFGYPGAQLLGGSGDPLPVQVVRGGGTLFRDPGAARFVVPPGGGATLALQ